MPPKVSIIIPIYNSAPFLERCLSSVTNQSLKDIEIICIDDGSTDNSLDILTNWAKRDDRITVISQENGKQGKARNAGIRRASAEYIGFIDSDDSIPANYYSELYTAAKSTNSDIAVCGIVKERQRVNRRVIGYSKRELFKLREEIVRAAAAPPHFHVVNKIYRRSFLVENSILFHEEVFYEDVMFTIRALCSCKSLITVPSTHYLYILNRDSTVKSRQTKEKQLQKYNAHKSMLQYVKEQGVEIAKRYQTINYRFCRVAGLDIWKIKEFNNRRTLWLFGIIPLCRWHIKDGSANISFPIDLVYMWVDGSDEQWRKRRDYYLHGEEIEDQGRSEARWIENDELKFSLRSVEMYANWIDKIYIVTDGQTPSWLNSENKRVVIVDHKDIMPASALPVFNSSAIESCIANIKELSEHFIIGNDDTLFADYTEPTTFFTESGIPIVRLLHQKHNREKAIKRGGYTLLIKRMQDLIRERFGKRIYHAPHHNFDPYLKSLYIEAQSHLPNLWSETAHHRFRHKNDMHRSFISYFMILKGCGVMRKVRRSNRGKLPLSMAGADSRCIPLSEKSIEATIRRYNPYMICLNDDELATDRDRERMIEFLKRIYPNKSQFEK